ncbi:hypothetical protein [Lutibacter flavus]|uniref:Uncharacterized protein n=1 Tax=Lutibacter flavus TaxID=691689 RepID=A0A238XID4_9FLAO|nr:hypothetical protein [Lutibacter flavus]SNR58697.1 hypothetical protein SAMN04488111_1854 [Lutibacter flavus]
MKDIVKLNEAINKLFTPHIVLYNDIHNITINGFWASEIDYDFHTKLVREIEKRIIRIADLGNNKKLLYFKTFHQDLLEKYNDFLQNDYEDIEVLKQSITRTVFSSESLKQPKWTSRDGYLVDENTTDKLEFIMDKLATMFHIEGWDSLDVLQDLDCDIHATLEEHIIEKIEESGDKKDDYIQTYGKEKEINFEKHYAFAHLSYCFDIHKKTLKHVVEYIDNTYQFIKKIENFEEDKLTLEEVFEGDPNNIKFEFKISKKEIAILFKNLNDFGIFHIDNKGFKHKHTQLKKYIDNANMYFPHNGEIKPVKGITKEFAKVYGEEERVMHQDIEKEFLKRLLDNLTERIKEIDSEDY